MPLFYFHLRWPGGIEEDDLGIEFPDLEHAYLEAYRAIPETMADLVQKGVNPLDRVFVIADAAGAVLLTVPLTETLRARRPAAPGRFARTQRLSEEIAAEIVRARETARQSRAILARARGLAP